MFANQKCCVSGSLQGFHMRTVVDTTLADAQYIRWNPFRKTQAGIQRYLKGVEIPVIHADNFRTTVQGGCEFFLVMDFHDNVHAVGDSKLPKATHFLRSKDCRDQ